MPHEDFHFSPASSFSLASIAELYTRTFAEYFYDAFITATLMEMFVRVEQIDLQRSPVMLVGGEPVGLATVGLRGERAYCKGFGIVVPFRGRGLAGPLCAEVIRQAGIAGARTLQLGVLKQNEPAVRTYLGAGFRVWRALQSFEWTQASNQTAGDDMLAGQAADPQALIQYYAAQHAVTPVWGRDLTSLQEMDTLQAIALPMESGLVPYIFYEAGEGDTTTIVDIAASRGDQGVALLAQLKRMHGHIVCNNEPEGSPMLDAFAAAGFRNVAQRFEMVMELKQGPGRNVEFQGVDDER